ncbi:uncharacterized protein LOC115330913 isoform X2 [Ixodes scapularis]|uniref:uncharacterized protein LOC115330913 isoform X2 n=1 Tax=Ixodes scapularis TaxID=6945 RepID=UPI001A9D5B64|nr:uncharacterized protein LOC115330913 isoform X2 [Ixodes scapularis]
MFLARDLGRIIQRFLKKCSALIPKLSFKADDGMIRRFFDHTCSIMESCEQRMGKTVEAVEMNPQLTPKDVEVLQRFFMCSLEGVPNVEVIKHVITFGRKVAG